MPSVPCPPRSCSPARRISYIAFSAVDRAGPAATRTGRELHCSTGKQSPREGPALAQPLRVAPALQLLLPRGLASTASPLTACLSSPTTYRPPPPVQGAPCSTSPPRPPLRLWPPADRPALWSSASPTLSACACARRERVGGLTCRPSASTVSSPPPRASTPLRRAHPTSPLSTLLLRCPQGHHGQRATGSGGQPSHGAPASASPPARHTRRRRLPRRRRHFVAIPARGLSSARTDWLVLSVVCVQAHSIGEVEAFVSISSALLINVGTVSRRRAGPCRDSWAAEARLLPAASAACQLPAVCLATPASADLLRHPFAGPSRAPLTPKQRSCRTTGWAA